MDRAAAQNLIDSHPPTGDQASIYAGNRELFGTVLDRIYAVLPESSAERTLAVRATVAASQALNTAVAVTGAGAAIPPMASR